MLRVSQLSRTCLSINCGITAGMARLHINEVSVSTPTDLFIAHLQPRREGAPPVMHFLMAELRFEDKNISIFS